jgi:peptidoglycan/xylan/chitin deacetylase (PgdA/CDA1 family)
MGWDELATLAADPLVTFGAHTVNHPILTKLDDKAARAEMASSRDVIAAALGTRPAHLGLSSWRPYGLRAPREFRIGSGAWLQDRGDDAPRRGVPQARRASDGAARAFRSTATSSVRATPRC